MKNLNPFSGLRQVSSGRIVIPKKKILLALRNKELKILDLGTMFFCLLVTDWDKSKYRFGYIRYSIEELSKIFRIPETTIRYQLDKAQNVGFVTNKEGCLSFRDYDDFTFLGSLKYNKTSDKELINIFEDLLPANESLDFSQAKDDPPLKSPHKESLSKTEQNSFTEEDKEWLNNQYVQEHTSSSKPFTMQDIINIFYDGNKNLFNECQLTY